MNFVLYEKFLLWIIRKRINSNHPVILRCLWNAECTPSITLRNMKEFLTNDRLLNWLSAINMADQLYPCEINLFEIHKYAWRLTDSSSLVWDSSKRFRILRDSYSLWKSNFFEFVLWFCQDSSRLSSKTLGIL